MTARSLSHQHDVAEPRSDREAGGPGGIGDFVAGLERPWSLEGLRVRLEAVARGEGLTRVALLSIPSVNERGSEMRVLVSNWSEEFRRGFERLGLHRYSPVVRSMLDGVEPFSWEAETLHAFDADDPDPNPQYDFLVAQGAPAGVYCPVHGISGFNGVLALFGTAAMDERRAQEAQGLAFAAFGIYSACRFEENRRNNPLTVRERECLALAMYGKTSGEIGTILNLSEHTISQYFTAAQRKLDASNRTHAVARAAQLGYLS